MPEMRFHSELIIQRVPAVRCHHQQVFTKNKESFTDADNFGITFPKGIDLSQKAVLLGAVFLIDFVHFENSGKRN